MNHLQSNYGLEALPIIANSLPEERIPLSQEIPLCLAEIKHAIKNEHALTATDVLARRHRLAMVDLVEAKRLIPIIENLFNDKGIVATELNLEC